MVGLTAIHRNRRHPGLGTCVPDLTDKVTRPQVSGPAPEIVHYSLASPTPAELRSGAREAAQDGELHYLSHLLLSSVRNVGTPSRSVRMVVFTGAARSRVRASRPAQRTKPAVRVIHECLDRMRWIYGPGMPRRFAAAARMARTISG